MLKKLRRWLTVIIVGLLLYRGYHIYRNVHLVLTYRGIVQDVLAEYDTEANEDLILAMIYTETKGRQADVMQSSESSTGLANTITDSRESVRQGVTLLTTNLISAQKAGVDVWTAVQAYNFGPAYIDYVAARGGQNTIQVADVYSRTVVAPSLGNQTGATYPYWNLVALINGGTRLYRNGGNIYYSRQVQMNVYVIQLVRLLT